MLASSLSNAASDQKQTVEDLWQKANIEFGIIKQLRSKIDENFDFLGSFGSEVEVKLCDFDLQPTLITPESDFYLDLVELADNRRIIRSLYKSKRACDKSSLDDQGTSEACTEAETQVLRVISQFDVFVGFTIC
ncbi:hypothetical protein SAMN06296036_1193 [Pseudobacteriovorax antillogorgiicola]|uniref:Uncharacterized protein n=2 Tax=Pseudobacteriovorax antillogorgiicola TaxID=1513793 RepID=A0A1Y6CD65_9BACT|nr:hypothetical protein EDD56_1192 [Pseudobacteriovorax antillogorgiicola]SMF57708.1 hypothetical protein SAMN06296036_1193 [Pseudobacteriovorax antillogorgiicola]